MDWWLLLGILMIGVAIGLLAGLVWFAWSMRDFMS